MYLSFPDTPRNYSSVDIVKRLPVEADGRVMEFNSQHRQDIFSSLAFKQTLPPTLKPIGTELKMSGCTPSFPIRLNGGVLKEEKAQLHLTV